MVNGTTRREKPKGQRMEMPWASVVASRAAPQALCTSTPQRASGHKVREGRREQSERRVTQRSSQEECKNAHKGGAELRPPPPPPGTSESRKECSARTWRCAASTPLFRLRQPPRVSTRGANPIATLYARTTRRAPRQAPRGAPGVASQHASERVGRRRGPRPSLRRG